MLRRAQEVLADHSLGSPAAKAELSELASAVETGCLSSSSSSLSLSPPRHRSTTDSCVTSSSEVESHAAAGSKRPCTCTVVEQPVQGKRTFFLQQSHEAEEAEDGSSPEIDLNR